MNTATVHKLVACRYLKLGAKLRILVCKMGTGTKYSPLFRRPKIDLDVTTKPADTGLHLCHGLYTGRNRFLRRDQAIIDDEGLDFWPSLESLSW